MTIRVDIEAVAKFQPQTVRGAHCDGIVDGKPVNVRRLKSGGLMPAIDSIFQTTFGTVFVVATYGHLAVVDL